MATDNRPIHPISGRPQCQAQFIGYDNRSHLCSRPDGHEPQSEMHATDKRTERASDYKARAGTVTD